MVQSKQQVARSTAGPECILASWKNTFLDQVTDHVAGYYLLIDFNSTGVIEIGLYSVTMDDGAPFGMEVMLASRQHSGIKPRRSRMRKILSNLGEKGPAIS